MKIVYIEPVFAVLTLKGRKPLCDSGEGGISFDGGGTTVIITPDNPSDFGDL